MIRTQIYLPEELETEIRFRARKDKKSKAEVIRGALKKGLEDKRASNLGNELLRIANLGGRGPKDLSTNHDDYLYGDKK